MGRCQRRISPSGRPRIAWLPTRWSCADDDIDPAAAQFAHQEIVVEEGVGEDHITGPEGAVHRPQEGGLTGALALVRRDGQVVAGAGRQRQQHGDPGQGKAQPRLLGRGLGVDRLVRRRVGHRDVRPVGDEDVPPVPFPLRRGRGLQLPGRPLRQGAQDAGGEAAPGVAVAGRVGRAGLQAAGGAVGDDARHGVAAALVVAEDLGEEAPEGRDRAEQSVPVPDAVRVEGVADPGFGQDVGEGEALVGGEAGTEPIQARPGIGWGVWRGTIERRSVG